MKIIGTIANIYQEQKQLCTNLQSKVDTLIKSIIEVKWHYISRLKAIESFALKIETGREIDDFFACTIVVENTLKITEALSIVEKHFTIVKKRPQNESITTNSPYSFMFDDLRLYCKLNPSLVGDNGPLYDVIFEIQIKTFLQHAWGIATHDLIYKSDDINWSKERIAFQIKASLEQAELVIGGIEQLINQPEVAKSNDESNKLLKILSFYKTKFPPDSLPQDTVRLCKSTYELLKSLKLDLADIETVLKEETSKGAGYKTTNLPPYMILIQSLINQRAISVENYINGNRGNFKIVLPREIDYKSLTISANSKIIKI